MTIMHRAAAIVIFCALSCCTALAADLSLKVDEDTKTISVMNNLPTQVTLLFLEKEDHRRLPLFVRLQETSSETVALRFTVPDGELLGVCEMADPPRGYHRETDGYYHLSAEFD